jgi:hypothetical protein
MNTHYMLSMLSALSFLLVNGVKSGDVWRRRILHTAQKDTDPVLLLDSV